MIPRSPVASGSPRILLAINPVIANKRGRESEYEGEHERPGPPSGLEKNRCGGHAGGRRNAGLLGQSEPDRTQRRERAHHSEFSKRCGDPHSAVKFSSASAVATRSTPLTANFVLVPSDHDGSPFAVQLHFSEPIDNKPRHVKQAFSVIGGTTGGSVTKAKRLNPQWQSGKRVASQWELTVTPSGAGDVVLAVPGGRSCSAGSALCTPARQSLSHDLSATIRDGTASSHGSRPGQTSPPGRVRDLRAEYTGAADYLIFFRIPLEGDGALKYHILVGGCAPGFHRIITVRGWSRYFYRSIAAGSSGRTRAFGVEGVNRNGTGPCVEVMTTGLPD